MEDRALACLVALRRVLGAADRNLRALARATGLTTPQLLVLRIVEEAREITPKMIASRAGIAPASATALIEKLAQLGYLTRQRSQVDRRQYWVSLTEAGTRALNAAPDPLHRQFREEFENLPDWEQAMIVAAFERVAGFIDRADAAPLPGQDVTTHRVATALPFDPESAASAAPPAAEPDRRRRRSPGDA